VAIFTDSKQRRFSKKADAGDSHTKNRKD